MILFDPKKYYHSGDDNEAALHTLPILRTGAFLSVAI